MAGRPPRLTAAAVRLIRAKFDARKAAGRQKQKEHWCKPLCQRYDISDSALYQICSRATYRWVE
jgi:hypothetical protein